MRLPLFHRTRDRSDQACEAAEAADRVHKRIEAQWPEVLKRAEWAREQRQRNHLTDLFFSLRDTPPNTFDLRGGKST